MNGDHFGAYGDPPSPSEIEMRDRIERLEKEKAELWELVLAARNLLVLNPERQPDEWYLAANVLATKLKPYRSIK